MKYPVVGSGYGKEMFKEFKQVCELAKQNISRAKYGQKVQYDKSFSEVKITTFREPYFVTEVRLTCATIMLINTPNGTEVNELWVAF